MHEITTQIDIDAPAQRVWSVLADFPRHPQWNPFVRAIEGEPVRGTKLKVRIQPSGGGGMTFRPTVLAAEPGRELRWRGRLLLPGVFDGEHYFRIEPTGPASVRFVHGERFSGLLVGMMKASLEQGTRAGFEQMNRALKQRAEEGAT